MWYVVILMCAVKKWSVEMVIGLVSSGSPGSPTGRRDLLSQSEMVIKSWCGRNWCCIGWWLIASYWRLCAAYLPSPLHCPLRLGSPPSISSSSSLVWVCFHWCCSVAYCVSRAAAVCWVSVSMWMLKKILWLVAVCSSYNSLLSAPLLSFGYIFLCELIFSRLQQHRW